VQQYHHLRFKNVAAAAVVGGGEEEEEDRSMFLSILRTILIV